jgi:type III secretory pathway component EscS
MNSITVLIIVLVTAAMAISAVSFSGSLLGVTSAITASLQEAQSQSYYVKLVSTPSVLSEQLQTFYVSITFNVPSSEYVIFQFVPNDQLQSPAMNLAETLTLNQLGVNSTEQQNLGIYSVQLPQIYGLSGQILNVNPEHAYLVKPYTTLSLSLNGTVISQLHINIHKESLLVWIVSKINGNYYALKYYYYSLIGDVIVPGYGSPLIITTSAVGPGGQSQGTNTGGSGSTQGGSIRPPFIAVGFPPFSSFLTGYLSDNDYAGTLNEVTPPVQNAMTLSTYAYPTDKIYPITLDSSGLVNLSHNIYLSKSAPEGGYIVWVGDAGILVGQGSLVIQNSKSSTSNYTFAFTIQLSNGSWVTVVDPNSVPTSVNFVAGVYNPSTGFLGLYLNGTMVAGGITQIHIPLSSSMSYIDIGSVSSSNNFLTRIIGLPGLSGMAGSQQYSFNGWIAMTLLYSQALSSAQISQLYEGYLPSVNNLIIMWTGNNLYYNASLLKGNSGPPGPPNPQLQPGLLKGNGGPPQQLQPEIPNMVNPNQYSLYWGSGAASPTNFQSPIPIIWGGTVPVIISGYNGDNITIAFSGYLDPAVDGNTTFYLGLALNYPYQINGGPNVAQLKYDPEYVQLYINGKMIVSKYYDGTGSYSTQFTYDLTSPANVTIIFSFINDGNNVMLDLQWQPPGATFSPIPLTQWTPF